MSSNAFMRSSQASRRVLAVVLLAAALAYPLVAYGLLTELPPAILAIGLVAALVLRLSLAPDAAPGPIRWAAVAAAAGVALLTMFDGVTAIKAYPVLISLGLATVFALTLLRPPSAIERIARLSGTVMNERTIAYTRNVTIIWLVFFLLNAAVSLWTARQSMEIWTLYNGLLSYLFVALLFAAEYAVRIFWRQAAGSAR